MDADRSLAVRICLSGIVLAAGFGFLLFGSGDASGNGLAASGIGLVLGHWMR